MTDPDPLVFKSTCGCQGSRLCAYHEGWESGWEHCEWKDEKEIVRLQAVLAAEVAAHEETKERLARAEVVQDQFAEALDWLRQLSAWPQDLVDMVVNRALEVHWAAVEARGRS